MNKRGVKYYDQPKDLVPHSPHHNINPFDDNIFSCDNDNDDDTNHKHYQKSKKGDKNRKFKKIDNYA